MPVTTCHFMHLPRTCQVHHITLSSAHCTPASFCQATLLFQWGTCHRLPASRDRCRPFALSVSLRSSSIHAALLPLPVMHHCCIHWGTCYLLRASRDRYRPFDLCASIGPLHRFGFRPFAVRLRLANRPSVRPKTGVRSSGRPTDFTASSLRSPARCFAVHR